MRKFVAVCMCFAIVASTMLVSGCISSDDDSDTEKKGTVSFALPPWPGVTVKTEVVKQILEEKGYTIEKNTLDAGIVYAEMAEGNIDVLLAGWLPVTHQDYWALYGDSLEQVNINIPSTWLGIAVPTYVYEQGVTSIYDLETYADEFDNRIVGIEPGAGIMASTTTAIDVYGLDSITLQSSSTPAMMAEVDSSINDEEWIAFTIWEPHSAFARFDVQKLEDPEEVYGGGDVVYTIAREGFSEDFPEVYAFLQNFAVDPDDQSGWILRYSDEGVDPEVVASEWIEENRDLVDSWWPS